MAKELRITATVPMPDDTFEQGTLLAGLKPHIDALAKELGVPVEAKIVRPGEGRKGKVAAEADPQPTTEGRPASRPHAVKAA